MKSSEIIALVIVAGAGIALLLRFFGKSAKKKCCDAPGSCHSEKKNG